MVRETSLREVAFQLRCEVKKEERVLQVEGTANPKPVTEKLGQGGHGWVDGVRWGCIGEQEPGLLWHRHSFAFPSDAQKSRALMSIPLFRGTSCLPQLCMFKLSWATPFLACHHS